MVASDHDNRNALCSSTQHHQELLIIQAIVGVEVVANIPIDEQPVDFLFTGNYAEHVIEGSVLFDVGIKVRPICKNNKAHLAIGIGDVC